MAGRCCGLRWRGGKGTPKDAVGVDSRWRDDVYYPKGQRKGWMCSRGAQETGFKKGDKFKWDGTPFPLSMTLSSILIVKHRLINSIFTWGECGWRYEALGRRALVSGHRATFSPRGWEPRQGRRKGFRTSKLVFIDDPDPLNVYFSRPRKRTVTLSWVSLSFMVRNLAQPLSSSQIGQWQSLKINTSAFSSNRSAEATNCFLIRVLCPQITHYILYMLSIDEFLPSKWRVSGKRRETLDLHCYRENGTLCDLMAELCCHGQDLLGDVARVWLLTWMDVIKGRTEELIGL